MNPNLLHVRTQRLDEKEPNPVFQSHTNAHITAIAISSFLQPKIGQPVKAR